MSTLTPDDLTGLSEQERDALEALDADEDRERDILQLLADEPDDPEEADEPDADAPAEASPPAAGEASPRPEPGAFVPDYAPPADFEAQMAELDKRRREVRDLRDDGEISASDCDAQIDSLDAQAAALKDAKFKADFAREMQEKHSRWLWESEQERFFAQPHTKAWIENPHLRDAFDTTVKRLANDPANGDKPMRWFLEESDRQLREAAQLVAARRAGAPPAARRPSAAAIPPTLGSLPSADLPEVQGADEFSHLERLAGIELERALARLSPGESERYLRSQ